MSKKRTTKKRPPCVTAWFMLGSTGEPMPFTGQYDLNFHKQKYPYARRAEYRLVPVRKAKR